VPRWWLPEWGRLCLSSPSPSKKDPAILIVKDKLVPRWWLTEWVDSCLSSLQSTSPFSSSRTPTASLSHQDRQKNNRKVLGHQDRQKQPESPQKSICYIHTNGIWDRRRPFSEEAPLRRRSCSQTDESWGCLLVGTAIDIVLESSSKEATPPFSSSRTSGAEVVVAEWGRLCLSSLHSKEGPRHSHHRQGRPRGGGWREWGRLCLSSLHSQRRTPPFLIVEDTTTASLSLATKTDKTGTESPLGHQDRQTTGKSTEINLLHTHKWIPRPRRPFSEKALLRRRAALRWRKLGMFLRYRYRYQPARNTEIKTRSDIFKFLWSPLEGISNHWINNNNRRSSDLNSE
jgi:hypothetical protein